MKVVIADDDAVYRKSISLALRKMGHTTLEARNGQMALELLKESRAQILVSDLTMPGMNGIELTRRIRDSEGTRYIYIIMVTGRHENLARQEALDAGVDDLMSKPLDRAMLTARMRAGVRIVEHQIALAEQFDKLKVAQQHIEDDLHAAAEAQRSLLPTFESDIHGIKIASTFEPSSIVSGDMFGCFRLTDEKLGFYSVDVSGHGVRASLLSVAIGHLITREFFCLKAIDAQGRNDPAALVQELNRRFADRCGDDYFTMFCGMFDKEQNRLDYCQAGAPSPLLISNDGSAQFVGDGGIPVGLLDFATFENATLDYTQGEKLVLYSDAVTEAENAENHQFGEDRLCQVARDAAGAGLSAIPKNIFEALRDWRQGKTLEDDLTVVALERSAE